MKINDIVSLKQLGDYFETKRIEVLNPITLHELYFKRKEFRCPSGAVVFEPLDNRATLDSRIIINEIIDMNWR